MDEIVSSLFNFIPETWRPYVAILLLVLYVITKARSVAKSDKIKKLTEVVSKSRKVVSFSSDDQDSESSPLKPTFREQVVDVIF